MKKVLSLVLALAMVLGSFSFVSAAPMSDVAGTGFEDAVTRLSALEVLTGYPDGSFKPANTITRAEFAAVAVRVKGLADAANASKGLATGFNDVTPAHWASGFVGIAGKMGIVNGVGNGLFAPEAPVKYEEAVTMVVRALGYEAAAQAKGAYPYGYLIVANEIGLLDQVKGTQGAPASRGIVAQITDNALEIPMMIQVGFGSDVKWVVSGSREHGTGASEQYLLDSLGFDSVVGRVTNVSKTSLTVTIEDTKEADRLGKNVGNTVRVDVAKDFDTYEVEGLEAKFWYNDELVISKVQEEAKYDAMKYLKADDEFKLITEDEEYEIGEVEDADFYYTITINDRKFKDGAGDELVDEEIADYAKVVLNKNDEIIWAQGYTLEGFVVVDEVDGFDVKSYDDYNEVDVEDFLIVKDGKTITVEDLEEGDVLYYNDDSDIEFAVVYNNSKVGEIERVYTNLSDGVRFGGKNYDVDQDAVYITEDGKIAELTVDVLDDIMDEEEEITIFTNFKNEITVVLASVEAGTSDFYVLTKAAYAYNGRNGDMLGLDVRNSKGEKLTLDVDADFVDANEDKNYKVQNADGDFVLATLNLSAGGTFVGLEKGKVLKITLDKDGDATEIVRMTPFEVKDNEEIEVKDSKVREKANSVDYRLKSNTVVFYDEYKKAILFGEAKDEFSEVEAERFYVEKGFVVAIVGETDADSDTTTVSGLFESNANIKQVNDDKLEIKIRVFGSNKTYVTKDAYTRSDFIATFNVGEVINLKIGDKSGKIESFELAKSVTGVVESASGRTIELADGTKYTLDSGYKVYKADLKETKLSAIEGETVTLYMDGNTARFVNYVIIN